MRLLAKLGLLVLLLALPLNVLAQEAVIGLDETVESELTDETPLIAYTLELDEPTSVVITMISETFDTYLELFDAEGTSIRTDDDSAGNLDSRIGPLELEEGTYTINAQSYAQYWGNTPVGTGEFTLSVGVSEVDLVEYGETVEGELTETAPSSLFTFTGDEGDVVIITLTSEDFDTYLTLNGPEGYELISNDDGAGNLDSLIGPYTLPQSGTYTIEANSLSGAALGSFTLSLELAELVTIAYGDTVDVELSEDTSVAYFSFEGTAGDVVSIGVESDGALDTNLQLNDPSNYLATSDEDGGSGFDPEISGYVLPSSGLYTVLVSAPFGGAGTVQLSLERGELPSLDDGPQTLNFSSDRTMASVSFEAEAGTEYRLTLRLTNGETMSPSIELLQNGSSFSYSSTSSVTEFSFAFIAPDDGELIIQINEYSYNNVSLEATIEAVGQ